MNLCWSIDFFCVLSSLILFAYRRYFLLAQNVCRYVQQCNKKTNNALNLNSESYNELHSDAQRFSNFTQSRRRNEKILIIFEESQNTFTLFDRREVEIKKYSPFFPDGSLFSINVLQHNFTDEMSEKKRSFFALLSHWQNRSIRSQNLNYYYSIVFHTVNTECVYILYRHYFFSTKKVFFCVLIQLQIRKRKT